MELKVKTAVLQNMVSKAIKAAGKDKIMPITELMGVDVRDNVLSLTATLDGSNVLTVYDKVEQAEGEFSGAVNADLFAKLIAKTTCEIMTLRAAGNVLSVHGNGSYSFPLSTEADDELVVIPQVAIPADVNVLSEVTAKVKDLKEAYAIGKTALAVNNAQQCFTGFYFYQNGSVTSDGGKATYAKKKIFEKDVLLSNAFMGLTGLLTGEDVKITETEDCVFMSVPGLNIVGHKMPEVGEFPIESIVQFTEQPFAHTVKLNKTALLNVLDRVALFIGQYDRNGVRFNFGEKGVLITDLKAASSEFLKADGDLSAFSVVLDIDSLKNMLSVNPDEAVSLSYGSQEAIKMQFGDTVQVLATQVDDNPGETK